MAYHRPSSIPPQITEPPRLALGIQNFVSYVKFQAAVFVENERAAAVQRYLLLGRHASWRRDPKPFQLASLQVDSLYVFGHGFAQNESVGAGALTRPNRQYACIRIPAQTKWTAVVPKESEHFVWIVPDRIEVNGRV